MALIKPASPRSAGRGGPGSRRVRADPRAHRHRGDRRPDLPGRPGLGHPEHGRHLGLATASSDSRPPARRRPFRLSGLGWRHASCRRHRSASARLTRRRSHTLRSPRFGVSFEERRNSLTCSIINALIARFSQDEEGQGLAEYALILALIAIVAIVALIFLGGQVSAILNTVGDLGLTPPPATSKAAGSAGGLLVSGRARRLSRPLPRCSRCIEAAISHRLTRPSGASRYVRRSPRLGRELSRKGGTPSMSLVNALIARFSQDEEGQGLAEYALILALIAIVAIVALIFLGGQISDDPEHGRRPRSSDRQLSIAGRRPSRSAAGDLRHGSWSRTSTRSHPPDGVAKDPASLALHCRRPPDDRGQATDC